MTVEYTPGTFNWIDLATTDTEGAKQFYTQLFGWSSQDLPAGEEGMIYTMLQKDGKNVAALYKMNQQQSSQGVPSHWMSYVTVSDVDEVSAKAKSLGGQVIMDPADVMDAGRMAVIQGATGEVFVLWQPKTHTGAEIVNEPGAFCWNELATNDTQKAAQFYTQLFGWSTRVDEMEHFTYTTFMNGERMNGGMMTILEEWGDVPPHWLVYFAVADCDGIADKAKSLGAQTLVPPRDIPSIGRFSVIQDPQGAVFAIITMNTPM